MRVMDPPPYETSGGTGIFGPQAPGRLPVSGDEAQNPLSDTTHLTDCSGLLALPDLNHLEGVQVGLDGVKENLVMGWERGMRRAFNVAFA